MKCIGSFEKVTLTAKLSNVCTLFCNSIDVHIHIFFYLFKMFLSILHCVSGLNTFQGSWCIQCAECETSSADFNPCEQCECG